MPCNAVNEAYCRADYANKGRSYKSCYQSDAGSHWRVECNCGPKWNTDKDKPQKPFKPKPPVFDLNLCLGICEGKYECEPIRRDSCKAACYFTAFLTGATGDDSAPPSP